MYICVCIYIHICIGNNCKYNYVMNIYEPLSGGAMQSSSIKRATSYVIRLSTRRRSLPWDRSTAVCCVLCVFCARVYASPCMYLHFHLYRIGSHTIGARNRRKSGEEGGGVGREEAKRRKKVKQRVSFPSSTSSRRRRRHSVPSVPLFRFRRQ